MWAFGQSIDAIPSIPLEKDSCDKLFAWTGATQTTQEGFKRQYDSSRKYIESCYWQEGSFHAFSGLRSAVQSYAPQDTSRYRRYREWLFTVVFLNTTDPLYFCAVIDAISNTYAYSEGERYPNAPLTIWRYMADNKYCPDWKWEKLYRDGIDAHLYYWRLGDTTVPFDSTLHDLDSLGLGFLKKLNSSHEKPVFSSVYLGNASVVPNPMTGSTTLNYELLRSGFIGYTIHDVLGNQVFARRSDFADAGKHEEQVILSPSLSAGTYYLRLNVGFGEIRTIRMVVVK